MTPSMKLSTIKRAYSNGPRVSAIEKDLDRAFALGHRFGIDRSADTLDQYDAAEAVARIRALAVADVKITAVEIELLSE